MPNCSEYIQHFSKFKVTNTFILAQPWPAPLHYCTQFMTILFLRSDPLQLCVCLASWDSEWCVRCQEDKFSMYEPVQHMLVSIIATLIWNQKTIPHTHTHTYTRQTHTDTKQHCNIVHPSLFVKKKEESSTLVYSITLLQRHVLHTLPGY